MIHIIASNYRLHMLHLLSQSKCNQNLNSGYKSTGLLHNQMIHQDGRYLTEGNAHKMQHNGCDIPDLAGRSSILFTSSNSRPSCVTSCLDMKRLRWKMTSWGQSALISYKSAQWVLPDMVTKACTINYTRWRFKTSVSECLALIT